MNLAKKIVIGLLSIGILSGCSSSGESTGSTEVPSTEREEITVYFTRHGKTMLNTTGRSQGWSD